MEEKTKKRPVELTEEEQAKVERKKKKMLKKRNKLKEKQDTVLTNQNALTEQLKNGPSTDVGQRPGQLEIREMSTNLANNKKITDAQFDSLLQYIASIKGQMRASTLKTAQDKADLEEKWKRALEDGQSEEEVKKAMADVRLESHVFQRAQEIMIFSVLHGVGDPLLYFLSVQDIA
eukprot:snap_masked-scaffold1264_size52097-processed-gene-0.3 protein:Tk08075 transcript:snap_masked-scaffold1264_size52097-processed-gene-0.3-mRNA-1 annotation:"hypothetical protein"